MEEMRNIESEAFFNLESHEIKARFNALFERIDGLKADYDASMLVLFENRTVLTQSEFTGLCNRLSLFEAYFTGDDEYFFEEFDRIVGEIEQRRIATIEE